MTARQCPECGGLVASTIEACPHCGHIMSNVTCDASSRGENPYNSLGWVILAIFLFWPLGLVSLYYQSSRRIIGIEATRRLLPQMVLRRVALPNTRCMPCWWHWR